MWPYATTLKDDEEEGSADYGGSDEGAAGPPPGLVTDATMSELEDDFQHHHRGPTGERTLRSTADAGGKTTHGCVHDHDAGMHAMVCVCVPPVGVSIVGMT